MAEAQDFWVRATGNNEYILSHQNAEYRKKLQEKIKLSSQVLMGAWAFGRPALNEHVEGVNQFCFDLESILVHGLEGDKKAATYARGLVSFWDYIQVAIKGGSTTLKDITKSVLKLSDVHTHDGKGRAWIREVLNQGEIVNAFEILIKSKCKEKWYTKHAFLCFEDNTSITQSLFGALISISFELTLNEANLDIRIQHEQPGAYELLKHPSDNYPQANQTSNSVRKKRRKKKNANIAVIGSPTLDPKPEVKKSSTVASLLAGESDYKSMLEEFIAESPEHQIPQLPGDVGSVVLDKEMYERLKKEKDDREREERRFKAEEHNKEVLRRAKEEQERKWREVEEESRRIDMALQEDAKKREIALQKEKEIKRAVEEKEEHRRKKIAKEKEMKRLADEAEVQRDQVEKKKEKERLRALEAFQEEEKQRRVKQEEIERKKKVIEPTNSSSMEKQESEKEIAVPTTPTPIQEPILQEIVTSPIHNTIQEEEEEWDGEGEVSMKKMNNLIARASTLLERAKKTEKIVKKLTIHNISSQKMAKSTEEESMEQKLEKLETLLQQTSFIDQMNLTSLIEESPYSERIKNLDDGKGEESVGEIIRVKGDASNYFLLSVAPDKTPLASVSESSIIKVLSISDSYREPPEYTAAQERGMIIETTNRGIVLDLSDSNEFPAEGDKWQIVKEQVPLQIPTRKFPPGIHCPSCNRKIEDGFIAKGSRYCHFYCRHFCLRCHNDESAVIPAYVFKKWDFTARKVSKPALSFLRRLSDEPLFNLKLINPFLYDSNESLRQTKMLRQRLFHIKAYLLSCNREDKNILRTIHPKRRHLVYHKMLFSLTDLSEIYDTSLLKILHELTERCATHIKQCDLCSKKGFICSFCNAKELIYPFQLKTATQCKGCDNFFHRKCYRKESCPVCEARLSNHAKSYQ